jgi:hypothetical protein
VGATAPLLQAETSDIGQLVESSQITEIPLNGRDVYSLVTLTAGAQSNVAASGVATGATGSANTTTRPAISGGRAGFTVFRISGIEVNEQNLAGAFLVPSVDAVQEFRAVTQIQSASESGTSGVNVALKSGTNKFHGSAYEFLRNNVLDAQPYFQVTLPPTPGFKNIGNQLRYNQFGGAVGGPIWKNRTFFFVSIQATRQRTLSQVREVLPTSAELSGDFSDVDQLTGVSFAPVYDPTTKAPFPGNIIPQSRFSSFASKLLPIAFQSANCSACLTGGLGFDYVGNQPGATNDTQYLGEIEHHIGAKDTLAASRLYEPFVQPFIPSPIPISYLIAPFTYHWGSLSETHVFSPKLLNVARVGYTREVGGWAQTEDAKGAFTFHNTPFSDPSLFPTLFIIGYPQFGNGFSSDTSSETSAHYDINDTLTWSQGKHEIHVGVEDVRAHFGFAFNVNSIFVYENGLPVNYGFTGNDFADFLLGLPYEGITYQGQGFTPGVKRSIWSTYFQDNWRILPRLTLNLGLRYDIPEAWRDVGAPRYNRLGKLDTSAYSQAIGGRFLLAGSPDYYVPGIGVVAGTGKPLVSGTIVNTPLTGVQPRIGFAYSPPNNDKTVISAGFGIYYGIQDEITLFSESLAPPYAYEVLQVNLPPTVPLGQPIHDNDFYLPSAAVGAASEGYDPRNRDPREYQWALRVQHELTKNLLFVVDYVGNHGVKLPLAYYVNQAQLPNANQLGTLLATPSLDYPLAQGRAPYPSVGITYLDDSNIGTSSYNAFNATAEGRFGQRLNFSAVYTFSKALDNASSEQDFPSYSYDLRLNKSYSIYDHPQRFVASWVYKPPIGDTFLRPENKFLRSILAWWEISGVATFEGGPPYNVVMGVDTSLRGNQVVYPNLVGPLVHNDIRKTFGTYLTPQNFVAPPFGQLGTVRRNAFHGPGENNFDLGLLKNIRLHDDSHWLQLRGELFNAFNHGQFQMLNAPLADAILPPSGGATVPTIQYYQSSVFGRANALPSRIIQIAVKVIF